MFFGDHQPTLLENAFFAELLGKPVDRLTDEEAAARYEVPFLIWANFDIEEATGVVTSANYLSLLVADACGIGRSDYMEFLARIREDYPVVTANFYYDAEGEFHRIDGLDGLPQELQDYALVQYGLLFDPDELSEYCLRG